MKYTLCKKLLVPLGVGCGIWRSGGCWEGVLGSRPTLKFPPQLLQLSPHSTASQPSATGAKLRQAYAGTGCCTLLPFATAGSFRLQPLPSIPNRSATVVSPVSNPPSTAFAATPETPFGFPLLQSTGRVGAQFSRRPWRGQTSPYTMAAMLQCDAPYLGHRRDLHHRKLLDLRNAANQCKRMPLPLVGSPCHPRRLPPAHYPAISSSAHPCHPSLCRCHGLLSRALRRPRCGVCRYPQRHPRVHSQPTDPLSCILGLLPLEYCVTGIAPFGVGAASRESDAGAVPCTAQKEETVTHNQNRQNQRAPNVDANVAGGVVPICGSTSG